MTNSGLESHREVARTSAASPALDQHALDRGRLYSVAEGAVLRPPPSAVLLSCENVLYDATVWERWLVRLLKHMRVGIDQHSFGQCWEQEFLREIHCGRREFDEAFRACLGQFGLSRGQIDEVAAASQGRRQQLLREVRPLPHVRQTVATLAQHGTALGLLADSDLNAAEIERQLTRLGFGSRFSFVLSSVELGFTKNESESYRVATTQFGKPVAQVAFVGSEPCHLSAAARLGMSTIAFNYDEQALADLYLRRFDDLATLVIHWPLGG
jgi:FMN phosphatase YigB (HAD superfamily)